MGRLTLEDVGRLSGVSRSTVSRVLNDAEAVSPGVRRRVQQVIAETGYGPNRAARSLASSRADVLGLVIPAAVEHVFGDPYFGRLVRGISDATTAASQTLALFVAAEREDEHDVFDRAVTGGLVDGLLVTASHTGVELPGRLRAAAVPAVSIGRPNDASDVHVDVDNHGGSAAATTHLLEHGRRRIGLVAGPSGTTTGIDRRNGHEAALRAAGHTPHDALVAEADFTRSGGRRAAARLLTTGVDALTCSSDVMARGALDAVADAGLRCPQDVAVVGFDDLLGLDDARPALTTVAQPVMDTGRRAVELLLDLVAGSRPPTARTELPTRLVVRRSCGCD